MCKLLMNSSADGISATIDASYFKGQGLRQGIEREFVMTEVFCAGNGQLDQAKLSSLVGCLDCMHDQKMVLHKTDKGDTNMEQGSQRKYVLRRLTPTECLRLQGLPDWWCDDVNRSDSAVYKMAGNGLAIPCACDVLGRIAEEMRKDG